MFNYDEESKIVNCYVCETYRNNYIFDKVDCIESFVDSIVLNKNMDSKYYIKLYNEFIGNPYLRTINQQTKLKDFKGCLDKDFDKESTKKDCRNVESTSLLSKNEEFILNWKKNICRIAIDIYKNKYIKNIVDHHNKYLKVIHNDKILEIFTNYISINNYSFQSTTAKRYQIPA